MTDLPKKVANVMKLENVNEIRNLCDVSNQLLQRRLSSDFYQFYCDHYNDYDRHDTDLND